MEEPDRTPSPLAASSSSSSSPGSRNDEVPGAASTSTSTSSSQSREENHEEDEDVQDNINQSPQHRVEGQPSVSYNGSFSRTDEPVVDDTWSCVVVILTLWMFVSMTLILGVYGSVDLKLGPNSSLLVKTNTLLVDYVKVKQLDDTSSGLMLYGFYTEPQLNVVTNWSEIWNISLSHGSHKDWPYYFNKGSQIKISYTLNSSQSSSLILVIAEGSAGLAQWLENPSYPTLSWNTIHGNGLIKQDIKKSTSYYVAVANLNTETVEVQLNLTMRSILYNTTGAYSKCIFTHRQCSLNLFFRTGNSALLTTPGPKEGTSNDEWHVKLSYAPRWIIYIMGIGGMTLLVVSAVHYFNNCQCRRENRDRDQYRETGSRRTPLLAQKDEDVLSWGSSYDSLSQGDEDPEDGLVDGKPLTDGDYNNNNTRRLCAICFDAPRDCFFLPCGHCVSCFACGTRIADASGTCPICRRNMKKVRKIFTV